MWQMREYFDVEWTMKNVCFATLFNRFSFLIQTAEGNLYPLKYLLLLAKTRVNYTTSVQFIFQRIFNYT